MVNEIRLTSGTLFGTKARSPKDQQRDGRQGEQEPSHRVIDALLEVRVLGVLVCAIDCKEQERDKDDPCDDLWGMVSAAALDQGEANNCNARCSCSSREGRRTERRLTWSTRPAIKTFVAVSTDIPPSPGSLPAEVPNKAPPASWTRMHTTSEVTKTAESAPRPFGLTRHSERACNGTHRSARSSA